MKGTKQRQVAALRDYYERQVKRVFPQAYCFEMKTVRPIKEQFVVMSDPREQHRLGTGPSARIAWFHASGLI